MVTIWPKSQDRGSEFSTKDSTPTAGTTLVFEKKASVSKYDFTNLIKNSNTSACEQLTLYKNTCKDSEHHAS